ncbi:MAG: Serine/threonine-protein kinase PknD [Acidobacteria bacterium]|nr:Serine/threonine-protein kinase PknD [Acidobacteriota bacterium]
MNPERWRRVEELFLTVADRPAAEREAYLTRVCGDDDELRREVLSLLACDTTEDFIQKPIAGAAVSLSPGSRNDLTGKRVGPYRLTRLIGRGGMGAVYEAAREDDQFRQQVAIKLIRGGLDSDFARKRFVRERQILASLDHPHIARLFDGGATEDGRPYFVMEFVDGEPITDYCRRRNLSLDEKLKLFRDVCSAVQHAHQKLVVHRDLKPSNILINKEGAPKLLDFGIAKLLTPEPGEAVTRTETAVRLMTPDYASPEQARGLGVTTVSDVYSLGVVLYELLTERRPFQFETYSPLEIERAICDTEAPAPSEVARQQTGGSPKLARQLEGDLDNIALMALRKEPERRYQSVEQFSDDLRRHLIGLPVKARPDTFSYRASKFARRHRVAVVAATLVLLSLLGGILATTRAARQARAERDRANQAAATAEAAIQSLVSVFEFTDPDKSLSHTITVKELLDQGAEKVVRELKDQPVAQARLIDTMGVLYHKLGVFDRAQELLEEALKLRRQTLGAESADVAASLHHLGALAYAKGDFAASEARFREALQLRRKLLGDEHPDVADSQSRLGLLLVDRGNLIEAEPLLRGALALGRRRLGSYKTLTNSLCGLARLLSKQGKVAEAADLYRQAPALYRELYGAESHAVADGLSYLALTLQELGDYTGAEFLFREVLAPQDAESRDMVWGLANLALLLQDKREYAEAERLYQQAVALQRKLFGENHQDLAGLMNNQAFLLREKGDYAGAEALFQQTLALNRKLHGELHPVTANTISNLAEVYFYKGRYNDALRLYRRALDDFLKLLHPDHWMVVRTRSFLGACLTKLKHYSEAEEQLLAAHAGLKTVRGEQHEVTRKTVSRLIELYEAWGKPGQAAPYRALPRAK